MALQNHNQDLSSVVKMKGGSGEESYHQNSDLQANALEFVRDLIEKSVVETAKIHSGSYDTIHVADLGCASGDNAVSAGKMIVKAFRRGFSENKIDPAPGLLIYFNDLPTNDFNNLFGIISDDDSEDSLVKMPGVFTAAVSGTFHGRLFPDRSVHFVFCCYALHWLSQVPEELKDKSCSAWNPGSVYFNGQANPIVAKCYARQFESDFLRFLQARSEETVKKGRMVLIIPGKDSQNPQTVGRMEATKILLNLAFENLISQGLLRKELLDTFNLPIFCPSVEELKEITERDGHFEIHTAQFLQNYKKLVETMDTKRKMEFGKLISKNLRAVFENLVEFHVGKDASAKIFEMMDQSVEDLWEDVVRLWANGGVVYLELSRK